MERRKESGSKSSLLPLDYLQMVQDVFTNHFDAGLKAIGQNLENPRFKATGEVFSNEIVVAVSLLSDNQLAATTVYASTDFDPKASSPNVQELLAACIDAIGSVFGNYLSPDHPELLSALAEESLSALENAPFEWTQVESDKKKIFVKIDKSNPEIDAMADDWLSKYDPELKKKEFDEQKEVESLFITGPKSKVRAGQGGGSNMSH